MTWISSPRPFISQDIITVDISCGTS